MTRRAVLALLAALGGCEPALAATCSAADLDDDCAVAVTDAQLAVLCVQKVAVPQVACDVNGDGSVNVVDVQAVINLVAPCSGVSACVECAVYEVHQLSGAVVPGTETPVDKGWRWVAFDAGVGWASFQAMRPGIPHAVPSGPIELSWPWPIVQFGAQPPLWLRLLSVDCYPDGVCTVDACASTVPGAVYSL